ncbi:helix-turn-helix domain-containing protein (plasmid) [Streptomyces sp. BI20]|uniref:helix-turn-helix domain-containing protein n=1 Tax=Streptomyces sp. BI20 TaxID=3403460 RepID=UPI003C786258
MDTHLLRSFVTVVDLRSFAAAARHLGRRRSDVLRHVAELEALEGSRLIHRKPVRVTEAGTLLRERARRLLDRAAGPVNPGPVLVPVPATVPRDPLGHR